MMALMGHISRAMIERYSHIRMAAKREAVEALTLAVSAKSTSSTDSRIAARTTLM